MRQPATPDDDGYQYGVMFHDGSVKHPWNGPGQRARAEADVVRIAQLYPGDRITLARRRGLGPWVRLH